MAETMTIETLKADLQAQADVLKAKAVALHADPANETRYCLRADCGMFITLDVDRFRLAGYGDGMAATLRTTQANAEAIGKRWNEGMTRAQIEARCWVRAMPIAAGVEMAIEDIEALIEKI